MESLDDLYLLTVIDSALCSFSVACNIPSHLRGIRFSNRRPSHVLSGHLITGVRFQVLMMMTEDCHHWSYDTT